MRAFYSFIILACSAILIFLPVSNGAYAFKTDERTDSFTIITGDVSNSTVQLYSNLYGNDTATIELVSHNSSDVPLFSSYNITTRALTIIGLAENTTRSFDVQYDVEADGLTAAIINFIDIIQWLWIIIWVLFPAAALVTIWRHD